MLIFIDVFTNDELCSDSYPHELVDDLIWEFKGEYVVRSEGEIVLAGASSSVNEQAENESTDENTQREIDFVLHHNLTEANYYEDPATFKSYFKGYIKRVLEHIKENGQSDAKIEDFKKKISAWLVGLLDKKRFENLKFFTSISMTDGLNDNGQVCIVEYRGEDKERTPYLLLIKEGLQEEKV